jgi:hypothetical protein
MEPGTYLSPTTGEIITPAPQAFSSITLERAPADVLADATRAAKALQQVIAGKAKPVQFNGETYLEFEDWQTCARFYGMTAKGTGTVYVTFGDVHGFKASAEVLDRDGRVISSAESMCLNDEEKWRARPKYEWVTNANGDRERRLIGEEPVPLFQIMSMAQTRACAKALRQVLAWVVVLAGFRPTPAEEMDGVAQSPKTGPSASSPTRESSASTNARTNARSKTISDAQRKRLYAIVKHAGIDDEDFKGYLQIVHGYESSKEIVWDKKDPHNYEAICAAVEDGTAAEWILSREAHGGDHDDAIDDRPAED